jgi:hypothetical protein
MNDFVGKGLIDCLKNFFGGRKGRGRGRSQKSCWVGVGMGNIVEVQCMCRNKGWEENRRIILHLLSIIDTIVFVVFIDLIADDDSQQYRILYEPSIMDQIEIFYKKK